MKLFDRFGLDGSYFILGLLFAQFLMFLFLIIVLVKHINLKKKYNAFMKGSDGTTLESSILNRFSEIEELKTITKNMNGSIDKIKENLLGTFQRASIVKYDAFKEMGGKLSFSMCLLDDNLDGFIITSMHSSREGCYTYAKEIIKGESFVILSEEEKQVLNEAKNKKNYMI